MHRNDLPPELFFEVLLRVPAYALVRCTLVCKLWFSIIKSPYFITAHIKYLKDISANDNLLLIDEHSSFLLPDITAAETRVIDHSFPVRSQTDRILGSCNGLVCLALRSDACWYVVLWNPVIRKCKVIDELKDQSDVGANSGSWFNAGADYALGWHQTHNDLRVVKIDMSHHITGISVYSLSTGTWDPLVGEGLPSMIFGWNHCFTNGAIHWITVVKVVEGLFYRITTLNIMEGSFKQMTLPEECYYLARNKCDGGSLVELRASLGFVSCWAPKSRRRKNYVDVWLMQEYGVESSWAKIFTMELDGCIERPLGFTKSERLICLYRQRKGEKAVVGTCDFAVRLTQVVQGMGESGVVLDYMETALLI